MTGSPPPTPQTDCVHVCTCVCWSSPVQSNPQQHQHNTAAPEGLKASIDRGSIQTLWGPSHSKSGVMEQEGEGAHFSPPGHRSFRRNCVCRGLTPSDAPIYTINSHRGWIRAHRGQKALKCWERGILDRRSSSAAPSSGILGASPYCSDPSSCLRSGRTRKGVAKGRIV